MKDTASTLCPLHTKAFPMCPPRHEAVCVRAPHFLSFFFLPQKIPFLSEVYPVFPRRSALPQSHGELFLHIEALFLYRAKPRRHKLHLYENRIPSLNYGYMLFLPHPTDATSDACKKYVPFPRAPAYDSIPNTADGKSLHLLCPFFLLYRSVSRVRSTLFQAF